MPLRGFARHPGARQTGGPPGPERTLTLAIVLLIVAVVAAASFVFLRRGSGRQRALAELLDSADALESRLREARAEIEAVAGSADNPVRDAMQEMLRQRLWLQQHGQDATVEQLAQVRDSIDEGRRRIDHQLARIERARAPTLH